VRSGRTGFFGRCRRLGFKKSNGVAVRCVDGPSIPMQNATPALERGSHFSENHISPRAQGKHMPKGSEKCLEWGGRDVPMVGRGERKKGVATGKIRLGGYFPSDKIRSIGQGGGWIVESVGKLLSCPQRGAERGTCKTVGRRINRAGGVGRRRKWDSCQKEGLCRAEIFSVAV